MKSLHTVHTLPAPTPSEVLAEAITETMDRYRLKPEDIVINTSDKGGICLQFWMEYNQKFKIDMEHRDEEERKRAR